MLFWELIRLNIKSLKFKIFVITFFAHILPIICLFLSSKIHDYKPLNLACKNIIYAPAKVTFGQYAKKSGKIYNNIGKQTVKPVTSNKSNSKPKNIKSAIKQIGNKLNNKKTKAVVPVKITPVKITPVTTAPVTTAPVTTAPVTTGATQSSKIEKVQKAAQEPIRMPIQEVVQEPEQAGGILGIDLGIEVGDFENENLLPWELVLKDGLAVKFYQLKIMDDIIENREPFFATVYVNNLGKSCIIKQSGCKIPVIRAAITKALLEFEYPKELYGKTKEFKV